VVNDSEPLNGDRYLRPTNPFVAFKKTDIEQSLSDRFEQQVNLYPERTAIENKGRAFSYCSLNSIANCIALALLQTRGKGQEPIALVLENGASIIAAILGVLKSGKIYVPLDSSLPRTRTEFILRDSQAELILTNNKNLSLARELTDGKIQLINVDELDSSLSIENLDLAISPGALAYVIYTSGSTGQPKGVVETHRNLLHNIMTNTNVLHISAEDRVSLLRSIGATGAARDAFTPLLNGAMLCPFPIKENGLGTLAGWLADEGITVFSSVITVFRHLVAILSGDERFDKLRLIYTGGEQVTTKDVELYQKHFSSDCLFVNRLGVSETGTVAYYFIDKRTLLVEGTVPVGYAAEDTEILLLDEDGKEVGPDCVGEIAVRSQYLSPGYWRSPEVTQSVFFPDPEGGDKRIYRTGDLGRKRPDGCLVHLGWKDFQVNIRGHRIDVAEVETALLNHPDVKEVAVVGREHWSGEIRLAAALVPVGNAVLPAVDLRKFLEIRLPDYMIPSAFMLLDALPLSPNGKVDRRALPSPDWSPLQQSSKYVAARTELEEFIVGIWEETLGLDVVGVHDSFFDLGGHSLLLGQIVSKLQSAFNVDVPLGNFVEQPTVVTLAEIIQTALRVNQGSIASIASVSRPRKLPLSFAQERLWFLDQLEPDTAAYNIPTATLIEGQLNVEAMEKALNEVGKRHEALRTAFTVINGEPTQVILQELSLTLPVVDLSDLSETESEAEARRLITEHAQRSFDLSKAPLLRALLLKLSHNKHVFVTIHHLIADAWSIGILFEELSIFYDMYSSGKSSALPELPVQYADFAVWQRQWLQGEALEFQVSYWKQQLGNNLSVVELPIDRPRPVRESFRGARRYFVLAEFLTDAIKDLSRCESVTLFMTLLVAFKTLLYRYSDREEVVVGSPIAGRNRAEVANLIGLFVNTLVLRTDFSGNPSFRELLHRVRAVCLEAYAHQDLPFEKLVQELQPERDLGRNPLFQVLFVLQNIPVSVINFTGLTARRLEVDSGTAKFDLTLSLAEQDKKLIGYFEYSTDLFDHSTIERMVDHFEALLAGIVVDPDQPISTLPLLTEVERHKLLVAWNDNGTDYPKDSCIHELFEAQAKRTPEAIAVEFEGKHWTYRELNAWANRLAHYLQGLGVGPKKLVGICVERSLETVIGLLGVLKVGGAYVPLDPHYPKERLAFMLADAQVSVVLTQERFIEDREPKIEGSDPQSSILDSQINTVCLDRDWKKIAQQSAENPDGEVTAENLAYVIYTSGSTGKPKGVQVSHRSLVNCLYSIRQQLGLAENEGFLAATTISFDIAAVELYLPLIVGAKVVLANRDAVLEGKQLLTRLAECSATAMQATPSTWRLLLDAGW
jgi:amino acid adenylation domain-containing protein